jgi:hypothetical protein
MLVWHRALGGGFWFPNHPITRSPDDPITRWPSLPLALYPTASQLIPYWRRFELALGFPDGPMTQIPTLPWYPTASHLLPVWRRFELAVGFPMAQ